MSSYISTIQTKLKAAGYYNGDIDGIAGPKTVTAVDSALKAREVLSGVEIRAVRESAKSEPMNKAEGFELSEASINKLKGVHPDLIRVVTLAIKYSTVDFKVIEGVRNRQRQMQLVKSGASQTMNSRHLTGHAVDLMPIVNGKGTFDFQYYYPMAAAMAKAATELGIKIRWGGCWEVITDKAGDPFTWVANYGAMRRKQGKKVFTDGPHFEIPA